MQTLSRPCSCMGSQLRGCRIPFDRVSDALGVWNILRGCSHDLVGNCSLSRVFRWFRLLEWYHPVVRVFPGGRPIAFLGAGEYHRSSDAREQFPVMIALARRLLAPSVGPFSFSFVSQTTCNGENRSWVVHHHWRVVSHWRLREVRKPALLGLPPILSIQRS